MSESILTCRTDQRRDAVRRKNLNGLDYLEVGADHKTLFVYFINQAPDPEHKPRVRLVGGRRIPARDIQILGTDVCPLDDPERDRCMSVMLDRSGDHSTYQLCVEDDEYNQFDPRYACLAFSFQAGCPSDLDCKVEPICPPKQYEEPALNYLAKDYASFRQLILDRLALIMPDWHERHVPDLGITLLELLAYAGDYLSYYQDAVATEAYLDTARRRISVRRHVRLVDYPMHEGCNARAWVVVEVNGTDEKELRPEDFYFIARYDDTPASTTPLHADDLPADVRYEVFEPLVPDPTKPIRFRKAHNEIHFYTWGERQCCLPRGATRATLVDGALELGRGDFLLFEEVVGPGTGNGADADPAHRHVVRLTRVEKCEDGLCDPPLPLLEVEWAEADALPFPLCLSAIVPGRECRYVEPISVTRANVLLVDHGRRESEELGVVPSKTPLLICEGEDQPAGVVAESGCFRPALGKTLLTFRQPLPADDPVSGRLTPAVRFLGQDPRRALPDVQVKTIPPAPEGGEPLFPPAALKNPKDLADLARDLAQESSMAFRHLLTQLSNGTRQLLEDCDDFDTLPAGLQNALLADLCGLLQEWTPERDLLGSTGDDAHFVVEMDEDGRAHLRFGDGEVGRRPEAGMAFTATYRVGSGPAGNVGANAISQLVLRQERLSGVTLRPRNPLPAGGGMPPEPISEVKLLAPHAFRKDLQRAITVEDYARLVERDFAGQVQRAAAQLRWTGSWCEVLVAVDQRGQAEADQALLDRVAEHLARYRRMGHDVRVVSARQVPLAIKLTVCVSPDFLRGHVKAALRELFSARLLPDGRPGFFHPDNLTFGEGIYLSKLIAQARSVPGVENVVVDRLERYGQPSKQAIDDGVLPLGPFEVARLDNDPSFAENGVLELELIGGR